MVTVSVHTEGKYAFVELRTAEMATASLQLNGQVGAPPGTQPGRAAQPTVVDALACAAWPSQCKRPMSPGIALPALRHRSALAHQLPGD